LNYNVGMSPQTRHQIKLAFWGTKVAAACKDGPPPFGHSRTQGSSIREKLAAALSKRRNVLLPHHLGRKVTKKASVEEWGNTLKNLGNQATTGLKGLSDKANQAFGGTGWQAPAIGAGMGAGIGLIGSDKNKTRNTLIGAAAGGLAGLGMNTFKQHQQPQQPAGVPTPQTEPQAGAAGPVSSADVAPGVFGSDLGGLVVPGAALTAGLRSSAGWAVPTVAGLGNDLSAAIRDGHGNIFKGLNTRANNLLANKAETNNYGSEMLSRATDEIGNYATGQTPVASNFVAMGKHLGRAATDNTPVAGSAYGDSSSALANQANKLTASLSQPAQGRFAYEVAPNGRTILRDTTNQAAVPRNIQELQQLQSQSPATAQQLLAALKQYMPDRYQELTQPTA